MKFKLGATIPVVQYGNIMPEIEVEADTYEEALTTAESYLIPLWNKYVEAGKQLSGGDRQLIDCFVGGQIYYDDASHTYTNEAGDVYLSGSRYAKQFEKPFNRDAIAQATANKFKVTPQEIIDFWQMKSKTSMEFGTAVHSAIEFYGKYKPLAEKLGKTSLHDHPILKDAVEGFYALQDGTHAESEVVVVDHGNKHAGTIDRLLITGDRECIVQDIKTGADITDRLNSYWKQLEFYANILERGDWKVRGLEIFAYNGKWEKLEKEFNYRSTK